MMHMNHKNKEFLKTARTLSKTTPERAATHPQNPSATPTRQQQHPSINTSSSLYTKHVSFPSNQPLPPLLGVVVLFRVPRPPPRLVGLGAGVVAVLGLARRLLGGGPRAGSVVGLGRGLVGRLLDGGRGDDGGEGVLALGGVGGGGGAGGVAVLGLLAGGAGTTSRPGRKVFVININTHGNINSIF